MFTLKPRKKDLIKGLCADCVFVAAQCAEDEVTDCPYFSKESAMCEANSNAVLDDVVKLLTEYTQYLYKFGYLDDDWIMEASSPIQEFINKKFGNVV